VVVYIVDRGQAKYRRFGRDLAAPADFGRLEFCRQSMARRLAPSPELKINGTTVGVRHGGTPTHAGAGRTWTSSREASRQATNGTCVTRCRENMFSMPVYRTKD